MSQPDGFTPDPWWSRRSPESSLRKRWSFGRDRTLDQDLWEKTGGVQGPGSPVTVTGGVEVVYGVPVVEMRSPTFLERTSGHGRGKKGVETGDDYYYISVSFVRN